MENVRKEKSRLDYKSPDFTITDTDLTFDLDLHNTVVSQFSHVKRLTDDKSVPLVLDGDNLKLVSVEVDGKECSFTETAKSLVITGIGDEFSLKVVTNIDPAANSLLMGLYVSDGKFCTQNEPEGFRRITYFLDRSDVLARYTTHIKAPDGQYPFMLSNGNLISDVVEGGIRTVTWQDPFAKPSYLFALVAGDFDELKRSFKTKSGKDVDVRLYVDKGQSSRGEVAINSILKAMAWDEKRFGFEYDLNRFNVVAVDFFNAGAMENKSLNIFNSKCTLGNHESATDSDLLMIENVIGHEYFHNWTGDRVTLRDWFQLSLKEGLTVFRDQEFSSDVECRPEMRLQAVRIIRGPQFAEDAGPMAHPVRPNFVMEMNNFYSVTVYDKGAEVIRMIHTILGEENFQKGMKLYIKRFDGSSATCEDFVSAMEDASEIDLKQFRNWYSQSGTPVVSGCLSYDADKKTCVISLHQDTPPTPRQSNKEPFVIPVSMALYTQSGSRIELKRNGCSVNKVQLLNKASDEWVFDEVPEKPIVALFQNFSAPVKLEFPYTEDELLVLVRSADDIFTRYDAIQTLIRNYVISNTANIERGVPASGADSVIAAMRSIFAAHISRRIKAMLLLIPSINEFMEYFKVVDVDALITVHDELVKQVVLALAPEFSKGYKEVFAEYEERIISNGKYQLDDTQIGSRAMASILLNYTARSLVLQDRAGEASELVLRHFRMADNMTDVKGPMMLAEQIGLECASEIMQAFELKWQKDPLVFDNYFRAVAASETPETLTKVKALMGHPCFDFNNPNRVRSLIGTFASNARWFHAADGSGYRFLTEILIRLNDSNENLAARLITPMISIKRYDNKRQQMIRKCFDKLLALPNLSTSLFEIVDKALRE